MELSKAFARQLLVFESEKEVPISHFSYKKRLTPFFETGVLVKMPVGKKSYRIQCNDYQYLLIYLKNQYQINDLRAYTNIDKNTTRSEATQIASNSKVTNKKVFTGIWFNAFQDISARLNGEIINLKPTKGSVSFFTEFEDLEIDKDIIIVGVENAENFTEVNLQQYLFDKSKRYLFTFRETKQSNALKQWLGNIENPYLHFGDFDLAGVNIFQSEFQSFLGERASFFVPDNLEALLEEYGSKSLYDKQYNQCRNLEGVGAATNFVINLIHRFQKGLEQEKLIIQTKTK
jgi:hypothetical protein